MTIAFTVQLTDAQAWALAQFLKRAGFNDYLALAIDKDEATAQVCVGNRRK